MRQRALVRERPRSARQRQASTASRTVSKPHGKRAPSNAAKCSISKPVAAETNKPVGPSPIPATGTTTSAVSAAPVKLTRTCGRDGLAARQRVCLLDAGSRKSASSRAAHARRDGSARAQPRLPREAAIRPPAARLTAARINAHVHHIRVHASIDVDRRETASEFPALSNARARA